MSIALEYFVTPEGLLMPFPGSPEQARCTVHHRDRGYLLFYRHDLPPQLRERIAALPPERVFRDHALVKRILVQQAPCKPMWQGKGYYFVRQPQPREFPDVVLREGRHVVMVGRAPVAQAWTVRQNERAAEVAVETRAEYRRRGYGRQVAAAWAYDVIREGKVAFFSHTLHNRPSEALARSLALVHYTTAVSYD